MQHDGGIFQCKAFPRVLIPPRQHAKEGRGEKSSEYLLDLYAAVLLHFEVQSRPKDLIRVWYCSGAAKTHAYN